MLFAFPWSAAAVGSRTCFLSSTASRVPSLEVSVTGPLLVLCMLLLGAQSVSAQRLGGPAASELFAYGARPTPATSQDTVFKVVEPTHWKLGLLLGASAGGLALGYLGYGFCHGDSEIDHSCFGPSAGPYSALPLAAPSAR